MTDLSYGQSPYLQDEYLTTQATAPSGTQFCAVISSAAKKLAAQAKAQITSQTQTTGLQFASVITDGSAPVGLQVAAQILDGTNSLGSQFTGSIPKTEFIGSQFSGNIRGEKFAGSQFATTILDGANSLGTQFNAIQGKETPMGAQLTGNIAATSKAGLQFAANITDGTNASGTQFDVLLAAQNKLGSQFTGNIGTTAVVGAQFLSQVTSQRGRTGLQALASITDGSKDLGVQFSSQVTDGQKFAGSQFSATVGVNQKWGVQFVGAIQSGKTAGTQFSVQITDGQKILGTSFQKNLLHIRADYLVQDYLVEPYLVKQMRVVLPMQFEAIPAGIKRLATQFSSEIRATDKVGTQFEGIIYKEVALGTQVRAIINELTPLATQFLSTVRTTKKLGCQFSGTIRQLVYAGSQFDSVHGYALGSQFRAILYNIKNLRVLWEFPSRGIAPGAWTSTSTAAGDFGIENTQNDIVEKVWRSANMVTTNIKLVCDSGLPQGIFLDTFAILNHNMTRSATFRIEGCVEPTFASPGFELILPVTVTNLYYVAPELPISGYRYWRISIDDMTNLDDYIQIGCIVFGAASIWTGETFSNPVTYSKIHFADKVLTEGYTNVSNDRGIKKKLGLDFQSINFSGGNYSNFVEMTETIRTTNKALWIPTPQYPSRYAIFGKLSSLPSETHTDNGENADYVNFSVEVDEAL
jgi:hypothetical protein